MLSPLEPPSPTKSEMILYSLSFSRSLFASLLCPGAGVELLDLLSSSCLRFSAFALRTASNFARFASISRLHSDMARPATTMSTSDEPRLLDSFSAPKEIFDEMAEAAEEEDYDPFRETQKTRQIASRRSDYANRHLEIERIGVSIDPFAQDADGNAAQGAGYQDAMRVQRGAGT